MRLIARGPVAVASRAWIAASGPMTTVVARVTFDLKPLSSTVAARPEPPRSEDRMVPGSSGALVVREPSDLVPLKSRADVLVVGRAYSPGRPVNDLEARVIVGELEKAVRVTGPRRFDPQGAPTVPTTFTEAPLDFTNAAGGDETWNPVGVRSTVRDAADRSPAPTILPLGAELGSRDDYVAPAGLGPIPATWRPRRDRLPAGASGWLEPASTEARWPEGAEGSFFQSALSDQQLSRPLRADERIVLEHLHPEQARFVTSLPGVPLSAAVVDAARGVEPLALVADTLWIDTERAIATLTYRAAVPTARLRGRDVFVWLEGFDAHVEQDIADAASETTQSGENRGGSLPFRPGAAVSPPARVRTAEEEEYERLATGTIAAPDATVGRVAMPFAKGATAAAAAPPLAPPPAPPLAPPAPPLAPAPAPPLAPPAPPLAPPAPPLAAPAPAASSLLGRVPFTTPGVVAAAPVVVPAWAPSPAPPAPVAAPRIDTWKLHEEASRRVAEEPGSEPSASSGTSLAEAPAASPQRPPPRAIEVAWFDSTTEIELAGRSRTLAQQLGEAEDEWESPAEAGGSLERARGDVARYLRRAAPQDLDRLGDLLIKALEGEAHERPFVVLSGELVWSFDPRESLRAWIALGAPMTADPRIKDAIEAAERAMQETLAPIPDVLHAALERLRDVVRSIAKTIGPTPIDAAAERYLVEERGFGRRRVWGTPRLRAHLHAKGARAPVPVYLSEGAGWEAPLSQRFPVRILGEIRTRQDPTEASTVCLRGVAYGIEIT